MKESNVGLLNLVSCWIFIVLRYSFTIDGEMPLKLYVKLYKTVKGADYCREVIFTNGAKYEPCSYT